MEICNFFPGWSEEPYMILNPQEINQYSMVIIGLIKKGIYIITGFKWTYVCSLVNYVAWIISTIKIMFVSSMILLKIRSISVSRSAHNPLCRVTWSSTRYFSYYIMGNRRHILDARIIWISKMRWGFHTGLSLVKNDTGPNDITVVPLFQYISMKTLSPW